MVLKASRSDGTPRLFHLQRKSSVCVTVRKVNSSRRSPFDFVSGGIGNFSLALRSGLSGEKQSNGNHKDARRSGEPGPLLKNCIPCELPRRTGLPLHPTTRSQNQSSFRLIVKIGRTESNREPVRKI